MLVFVIGAPGSGKGTLCRKLCTNVGCSHLSVGDHLRGILQTRSQPLDPHVITCIKNSKLLQVNDLLPILRTAIDRLEQAGAKVIIVDGFPRQMEQVQSVKDYDMEPQLVLFFDCPGDIARGRYLSRALAARDSSVQVFERRHEEFLRLNGPLVQEYAARGILLTVDTSSNTETSYNALLQALQTVDCGLPLQGERGGILS